MCANEQVNESRERKNACVFQDITAELNWVDPGRHHCIHSSTSVHTFSDLPKLKTEGFIRERLKENEFCFGKVLIFLHSPSFYHPFSLQFICLSSFSYSKLGSFGLADHGFSIVKNYMNSLKVHSELHSKI